VRWATGIFDRFIPCPGRLQTRESKPLCHNFSQTRASQAVARDNESCTGLASRSDWRRATVELQLLRVALSLASRCGSPGCMWLSASAAPHPCSNWTTLRYSTLSRSSLRMPPPQAAAGGSVGPMPEEQRARMWCVVNDCWLNQAQ